LRALACHVTYTQVSSFVINVAQRVSVVVDLRELPQIHVERHDHGSRPSVYLRIQSMSMAAMPNANEPDCKSCASHSRARTPAIAQDCGNGGCKSSIGFNHQVTDSDSDSEASSAHSAFMLVPKPSEEKMEDRNSSIQDCTWPVCRHNSRQLPPFTRPPNFAYAPDSTTERENLYAALTPRDVHVVVVDLREQFMWFATATDRALI
jgi:hypothetical protein